jgi:hypothetical protein
VSEPIRFVNAVDGAKAILEEAVEKRAIAREMAAKIKAKLTTEEIAAALAAPGGPTLGLLNALLAKERRK